MDLKACSAKNNTFVRALQCLTHPTSLAAILILLMNDHWLKQTHASFLTGKISDFAGLYFFPFLLIASISFLIGHFQISGKHIPHFSFLLTGLLFALIQLDPSFCASIESALSTLLNSPIAITPDITDLIALTALLPALHLWRTQNDRSSNFNKVFSSAAYFVALIATMSTSCIPPVEVDQVIVDDGLVYLEAYDYMEGGTSIPFSDDQGQTWSHIAVDSLPRPVSEQLEEVPRQPKTVCLDIDPEECFRITGASVVEHTTNAGEDWNIVWKYPVWRLSFQERRDSFLCGVGEIQIEPLDIALVSDSSNDTTVLVAMGNQGLLVRTPDGTWEQADVPGVHPLPSRAETLSTAWRAIIYERYIYGVLAISVWLVLHAVGWKHMLSQRGEQATSRKVSWWAIRIFLISLIPSIINIVLLIFSHPNLFLFYLTFAILIIGPILTWRMQIDRHSSKLYADISILSAVASTGLFAVPIVLSLFWALGLIPLHSMTVALNLIVYWFILRLSFRKLKLLTSEKSV